MNRPHDQYDQYDDRGDEHDDIALLDLPGLHRVEPHAISDPVVLAERRGRKPIDVLAHRGRERPRLGSVGARAFQYDEARGIFDGDAPAIRRVRDPDAEAILS